MSAVDTIQKALKLLIPSLDYTNASIEKKIIDVVGSYADTEAIERQNTLATIQTALAQQKVTGIEYYRRRAVAYQEGDELLIDPVSQAGYYATVDEEAQIIKQAYIVGLYPQYTLLVNVIGDDGHLAALSKSQLASFKTYFTAYQPIGLDLNHPVAAGSSDHGPRYRDLRQQRYGRRGGRRYDPTEPHGSRTSAS